MRAQLDELLDTMGAALARWPLAFAVALAIVIGAWVAAEKRKRLRVQQVAEVLFVALLFWIAAGSVALMRGQP